LPCPFLLYCKELCALPPSHIPKQIEKCVAAVGHNIEVEFHMYRMLTRGYFIKGYQIDRDKLRQNFGTREDDPQNTRFLGLWEKFPGPFLYLASGIEPGEDTGEINFVVELSTVAMKPALSVTCRGLPKKKESGGSHKS